MRSRHLTVALAVVLVASSAAFAVDPTAGADPRPARFDDAVTMGMTGVQIVSARGQGYDIPRAQAFYSQYEYVVGYYGVESLVAELDRDAHDQQFGMPLAIYVTDYARMDLRLTDEGYLNASDRRRWVQAEDASFVVGSEARTTAGPAIVPFSDRAAAEAFVAAHGGTIEPWAAVRQRDVADRSSDAAAWRERVADRHAWANETVADARTLLDRPVSVTVGEDAPTIQAAVERAPPNTTVRVPAGTYPTNLTVSKPVTVRGAGNATTLRGDGNGSVVRVNSPRVALSSVRVTGVGDNVSIENTPDVDTGAWDISVQLAYGYGDAAVELDGADGSLVHDVSITTPANGVVLRDARDPVVDGVTVHGSETWQDGFMGVMVMRSRPVIQNSTFTGGRDAVYSHRGGGMVVRDNHMTNMRFGVHEMYTSDTLVADNAVRETDAGVIVMTGPEGNALVGNDVRRSQSGVVPAGSDSFVADNVVVDNRYGLHVAGKRTVFVGNVVAHNDVGVRAATIIPTNAVYDNDVAANDRYVVATVGPLRVWSRDGRGNYWSGAPGADRNGDGTLDRTFHPSGTVDSRAVRVDGGPSLVRAPAVTILRRLQDTVPAMRPTGVVDTAPRASPVDPDALAAVNATRKPAAEQQP
ncbi:NosD domain-containing protein [Halobacteriaceae archaeon GCM10025711]